MAGNMIQYKADDIKNIAVAGHGGSGNDVSDRELGRS